MRTVAFSLFALGSLWISPAAQAQDTLLPLRLVPARVDLALDRAPAAAGVTPAFAPSADSKARTAWKRSLLAVAASQSLDVASSYGLRELNPLLASSDGRFGGRAASIKLGTTAAVVALEYVLVKKYPKTARVFSKLNWSSSALTTGLAVHNFAIR